MQWIKKKQKKREHEYNTKEIHETTHKRKNKKKGTKKKYKSKGKIKFKMAINTYLSIITLNVNRLNAPVKRHRVVYWIKKNKSLHYSAYKRPTLGQRTHKN